MKKFGLRIGDIGIEFSDVQSRDKALMDFAKGSDVKISDSGVRFTDGKGSFSVYDRDTKETIVNCCQCQGVFDIQSCTNRTYPHKHSWEKEYTDKEGFICDACLTKLTKDKEVFNAKKLLNQDE